MAVLWYFGALPGPLALLFAIRRFRKLALDFDDVASGTATQLTQRS
jgi:hypothetical protein